ncbi:hypothetical protein QR680_005901 [Steinernema hermaphroditum]|uniref:Large ribosomal subunit protein mL42 n=1 Tax=Steinernema hermaphroditum TaxID=289476 RepID=A0AA39HUS6_9BILA|nr:hypothetical protein QR680_005901 [Steinernema hermaphroditum]
MFVPKVVKQRSYAWPRSQKAESCVCESERFLGDLEISPFKMQSICQRLTPLRTVGRMANSRASSSKSSVDMSKPHVVVCPNGVIACWHPKTAFPYEHTRPIDKADMSFQKAKDQSVFNDAVMTDYEKSKMRRGPNNAELREIFYTNKHEWYSRTREDRLYDVAAPVPERKK